MGESFPFRVGKFISDSTVNVRYFPIFADMEGQVVVVSGAGDVAAGKLRLLLKTPARIVVYGDDPVDEVLGWHNEGRIELMARGLQKDDSLDCLLFYAANERDRENERVLAIASESDALINTVDDQRRSQFITPAIVDRRPVTVAIGTEGTAPVLARRIKAAIEEMLPIAIGGVADACGRFRNRLASLGEGRLKRGFWEMIFPMADPFVHSRTDLPSFREHLGNVLDGTSWQEGGTGTVTFVGAGPGDPDLLTCRARQEIDRADVVLHDRLVPEAIVDLARREAKILKVGKQAYIGGWKQDDINRLMIDHANNGDRVVRLKSGDPVLFGRLDEEIAALEANGTRYSVIPGITSASAAAAAIGRSLTRRHRNSSLRFATGHDLDGFTELDWAELVRPGAVTAIYMGRKSARFLRGRLLMHGAEAGMRVTVVFNATRTDETIKSATLGNLPEIIGNAELTAPMIILLGLSADEAIDVDSPDLAMEQA